MSPERKPRAQGPGLRLMRTSRDQGALDAPILSHSRKAQNCYLAMAAMRPTAGHSNRRPGLSQLAERRSRHDQLTNAALSLTAEPPGQHKKRWFRYGQKWRTGCEGRISVVKRRHGLDRCRYKGFDGMNRWVGLGIIADNVVNCGIRRKADRDSDGRRTAIR